MTAVTTRPPTPQDGAAVASLIREAGTLEPNTTYAYVLLCTHFAQTCAVAESDSMLVGSGSMLVGCVLGYRIPERPDTLFAWQIGVSPTARRRGVGRRLLDELIRRPTLRDIDFIETTVAPSNAASRALFERWAEAHGMNFQCVGTLDSSLFGPAGDHEKEELYKIGPIVRKS